MRGASCRSTKCKLKDSASFYQTRQSPWTSRFNPKGCPLSIHMILPSGYGNGQHPIWRYPPGRRSFPRLVGVLGRRAFRPWGHARRPRVATGPRHPEGRSPSSTAHCSCPCRLLANVCQQSTIYWTVGHGLGLSLVMGSCKQQYTMPGWHSRNVGCCFFLSGRNCRSALMWQDQMTSSCIEI